jgi:hypothetical protein
MCLCGKFLHLQQPPYGFIQQRSTFQEEQSHELENLLSLCYLEHRVGGKTTTDNLTRNVAREGNPQKSPSNLRLHLPRRSGPLNPAATRATASLELAFHPSTYYSTTRTTSTGRGNFFNSLNIELTRLSLPNIKDYQHLSFTVLVFVHHKPPFPPRSPLPFLHKQI